MDLPKSAKTDPTPFLKWAGGKQWLARHIARLLARSDHRYFEPFMGGGSLFFTVLPRIAFLSDINRELIETFSAVRDGPRRVLEHLAKWENQKDVYYKIRGHESRHRYEKAARFIYLNKACWNGLYRVNRQGKFNVPYGNNGRAIVDSANLISASVALKSAKIAACDFEEAVARADRYDFVYLDPPYTILHSNNGFRRYNEKPFSWADQIRLASTAEDLVRRGCTVVVSNADHLEVRALYPRFEYFQLMRQSTLAANSEQRRITSEAIFISLDVAKRFEMRSLK